MRWLSGGEIALDLSVRFQIQLVAFGKRPFGATLLCLTNFYSVFHSVLEER